jgi:hypothetical protein
MDALKTNFATSANITQAKPTKNIAVLTTAFNELNCLPACVRQFKKQGEYSRREDFMHMVLLSKKPWRGHFGYDKATWDAAQPAQWVEVGEWENQADQLNYGLEQLQNVGYEWAMIVDADEYYTTNDIYALKETIQRAKPQTEGFRASKMSVYWKLPIFKLVPDEPGAIIALRTDQRFTSMRRSDAVVDIAPVETHHFSYVRTNNEMKQKLASFEHSHEIVDDWYNKVWLNWEIYSKNLHPVVPEQWKYAIYDPAPRDVVENYYANKTDFYRT